MQEIKFNNSTTEGLRNRYRRLNIIMVTLNCFNCKEDFPVTKQRRSCGLSAYKHKGIKYYCSSECKHTATGCVVSRAIPCKTCNKEVMRSKTNSENVFCSRTCSAIFNNTNRDKKTTTTICCGCGDQIKHESYILRSYCSNTCQLRHKRATILNGLIEGTIKKVTRPTVYRLLVEERGNHCEICKLTDWNGQPIRLWVDHIDGCATNNNWSNFRLICPNCDSQLDTCRAKNKGKGRKSLGVKY
jgi:hypothetical protein